MCFCQFFQFPDRRDLFGNRPESVSGVNKQAAGRPRRIQIRLDISDINRFFDAVSLADQFDIPAFLPAGISGSAVAGAGRWVCCIPATMGPRALHARMSRSAPSSKTAGIRRLRKRYPRGRTSAKSGFEKSCRPIAARCSRTCQINTHFFPLENADLGKRKRRLNECMVIG